MFLTVRRSSNPRQSTVREVGLRSRFDQLEMRIFEIIEATISVSAAQPIRFRGQIQDHCLPYSPPLRISEVCARS
jgi:hypothetical protein